VQVLVVWLPVGVRDVAPPTKGVLARLKDSRAAQFWDGGRLTSAAFRRSVAADPLWTKLGDPEHFWSRRVAYDVVAIFPQGSRWETLVPAPDYYAYPLVDGIDELEKRLDSMTP
jgi:hypothetical protein